MHACNATHASYATVRAVAQSCTTQQCEADVVQDKVDGTPEQKEAAAEKFAEINHGMCPLRMCLPDGS